MFVIIQIKCGATVLKNWKACNIENESSTCADIFTLFASGDLDGSPLADRYSTVAIQTRARKSTDAKFIKVQVDTLAKDVLTHIGVYLEFLVSLNIESELLQDNKSSPSAFAVLMSAAKKKLVLPPIEKSSDNKKRLRNELRKFLQDNQVGWSNDSVGIFGKQFINVVGECLWYLDGCHETMKERALGVPDEIKHLSGYNKPETHNHKRKTERSLDYKSLQEHSIAVFHLTSSSYMKSIEWTKIREILLRLADNMRRYADFLTCKKAKVQQNHSRVFSDDTKSQFQVQKPSVTTNPTLRARYRAISEKCLTAANYEVISLDEFSPVNDRRRKHDYLQHLVVPVRYVQYTHSTGYINLNFMWKVPENEQVEQILDRSTKVRDELIKNIPKYHTRAMRREFITSFGRVLDCKSAVLREMYRRLTGDSFASRTTEEATIDKRVQDMLDLEDPDIICDLRVLNSGRPEQYDAFLNECKAYIDSTVDTAVDERRHDQVQQNEAIVHLAKAISVPDLHKRVRERLPAGTPVPSEQWLRLQFWPNRVSSHTASYHKGKLKLKFMIQSRQFRKGHIDCHYASALFRYQKEFAIRYKQFANFICMDDKHTCKVGEPGYPVAAVDRGKKVVVSTDSSFQVADHDFTKFSITPSVTLVIDIPDTIEGSFYRGQVHVGVKENSFEPSSALRHMCELGTYEGNEKPITLLYTDGGSDHRLTFLSVQFALIAYFLKHNKDLLIAVRTPPYNSWKDPAERVMSILNLGLNAVGLMRATTDKDVEELLKSRNNLKEIRLLGKDKPFIKEKVKESMQPIKDLLSNVFQRLSLKEKNFKIFHACSEEDMNVLWEEIKKVDSSLEKSDTSKERVQDKVFLQNFLSNHCRVRQYCFQVKKCGNTNCVCGEVRLPSEVFQTLNFLPDPVPGNDEHYKSFDDLYGKDTTEEYLPSLKEKAAKSHCLPFSPTAQTAKNTGLVLQCSSCLKWRLIHAKRKLKPAVLISVNKELELLSYTCGSLFQDLGEGSVLAGEVFVRGNLTCQSPIEFAFYIAQSDPICFYCGKEENLIEKPEIYPLCLECDAKKDRVKRRCHTFKAKE